MSAYTSEGADGRFFETHLRPAILALFSLCHVRRFRAVVWIGFADGHDSKVVTFPQGSLTDEQATAVVTVIKSGDKPA